MRVPFGPLLGGCPDGHLLFRGPAVVRSGYGHLHRSHRLAQNGERVQRPRRTAAVPGRQVQCVQYFFIFVYLRGFFVHF